MYRLIFQNVDGLEISNEASTLEKISDNMLSKEWILRTYPKKIRIGNTQEANIKWQNHAINFGPELNL